MSKDFLILDNDAEDMVMEVHRYQRVTGGGANEPNIRISDMKNYGVFLENPLKNGSYDAVEDALLTNSNLNVDSL